tara:strand:- start:97 stop:639 length:543 start_codon:yes stop_codon:yes gene_type:complete
MCKSNKIECPRCGGAGKVEHTHIVEGVCFMCAGFGDVLPKRVGELTEKAKIRKANKDSKYQQELKESKEIEDRYFNNVYAEITKRNKEYFKNYKCAKHENAIKFYSQIKRMSKNLGFNENSSEKEVRQMFKDYFKGVTYNYRLEITKYTLKYHNFYFIDLDGRNIDLTDCEHEVQNIIKR